jgi:hypothetical protein
MSIGKYISLEEARNTDKLDRFAKEHPSKGDKKLFGKLFKAMAKTTSTDDQTSGKASSAGYSGTRTRRGT